MASGFSGYYENLSLDYKISSAGTCQVALSTTEPFLDDTVITGSTQGLLAGSFTEVVGGSYARQSLPVASWDAAVDRIKTTNAAITFPSPTADWGIVQYFVIFDSTGTRALLVGALDTEFEILDGGEALSIPIGGISIDHPL